MLGTYRLWTKIANYAKRQERKAFLKLYGFDCRCPHCKQWQGNVGNVQNIQRDFPDSNHDAYKCGGCDKWFIMDCRGMVATVAQDQSPALTLEESQWRSDPY